MMRSIRQSLGTGASMQTVVLLVLLVVLFVMFVVWTEMRKSSRRRLISNSLGWDKFRERAVHLRLPPEDTAFLTEVIQTAGADNADSVLNSPAVFENVLEHYYEIQGLHTLSDAQFKKVRVLRERLGFAHLSNEIPYVSSRQFQLHSRAPAMLVGKGGDPVQKGDDPQDAGHKWMTAIVDVNERYWSVLRPEGPVVPVGTHIKVNLTRPGDAEYRIQTQVIEDSSGELHLKHTRELFRNQLRNWVRVDVDIPAKVLRVMPGDVRDRVEELMVGRIRDLSGGGLSVSLGSRLEKGAQLDLEFELPGHGMMRGLRVRIIRVAGPLNGDITKIVHSASFEGDYKALQERIIHFVFEKQRQEARMRDGL